MTAPTCGARTGVTAGMVTNYLQTPGHALILMNVKTLTDALELASMNREVISATVLPDTGNVTRMAKMRPLLSRCKNNLGL